MTTISAATPADVPALADLLAVLYAQEAEFIFERTTQERGLRLILAAPALGQIFVARDEERLLGMVNLLFTISTAEGAPACWLEDVVVRPESRGVGIGGQLVEHAIDYARRHGFRRISLLTDRTNEAAQRFYARHGFVSSPMAPLRLRLFD
ncbi:MAG: GNAT family N-acetyltransferase [Pirellulales bacterium]